MTKVSNFKENTVKKDVYYRKNKLTPHEWDQFNSELNTLLSNVESAVRSDVNSYTNIIINAYQNVINKYMPLKILKKKQTTSYDKPWITQGLKVSIKKKNDIFTELKKTNNQTFSPLYKLIGILLHY